MCCFFFQAEDGIRDLTVTGVQTCALPIWRLGSILLDHDEAAAWCLPGAGGQVVLTTAAVHALDEAQLAAVLAHERAHQRGRHHLLVALAGSLAAAFPRGRAVPQGHEPGARPAGVPAAA